MLKQDARQLYRKKRKELTEKELSRMDDLILIHFQSISLPAIHRVLSFWPIAENNEPNTFHLVDFLSFRNPGLVTCYPVCNYTDQTMDAVATDAKTSYEQHPLHFLQPVAGDVILPVEIDLVLVPLLAIDMEGYRVGYGKGFYDRYLAQCRPDCLKVGLSFFDPLPEIKDRDQFDVPLDLCITPKATYVF